MSFEYTYQVWKGQTKITVPHIVDKIIHHLVKYLKEKQTETGHVIQGIPNLTLIPYDRELGVSLNVISLPCIGNCQVLARIRKVVDLKVCFVLCGCFTLLTLIRVNFCP